MRVLLRADAGSFQGTGHVMRCLTLAEELMRRGHQVELMTGPLPPGWLADSVQSSGIALIPVDTDDLGAARILAREPDWVVVDSYRISSEAISGLALRVPLLAIVDGDDRDITATMFLDQNLGADSIECRAEMPGVRLLGADYALVRRAILEQRRPMPWLLIDDRPRVLVFMGGTDPTATTTAVCRVILPLLGNVHLTVVAPPALHVELTDIFAGVESATLLAPTPRLPELLGAADVVISACGTSAWDVCSLGLAAVLVAVVDNQVESLREAVTREVAVGVDLTDPHGSGLTSLPRLLSGLLTDTAQREHLSRTAMRTFDGLGPSRVAQAMELGVS